MEFKSWKCEKTRSLKAESILLVEILQILPSYSCQHHFMLGLYYRVYLLLLLGGNLVLSVDRDSYLLHFYPRKWKYSTFIIVVNESETFLSNLLLGEPRRFCLGQVRHQHNKIKGTASCEPGNPWVYHGLHESKLGISVLTPHSVCRE